MPRFFYVARNKENKKESGALEASNIEEAISRLQVKELLIVNIYPEQALDKGGAIQPAITQKHIRKHSGIKSEDLCLFCRQLATLLGAGVTIVRCLDIISEQVSSRRLHEVVKDVAKSMEGGLSLHEALRRHPKVFSDLWVNLVESGEASGNLATVLGRLATYLERSAAFKSKVISALIYPVILLTVGIGALLFLTIKIIPTFAELFKSFNAKLPFLTQVLIDISNFIKSKFLFILGGIIAAVLGLRVYTRTNEGRRNFEKFLFGLPVFGEFFRVFVIERFTSEMSTLVESGVPILYSLEIAERSVNNLTLGGIISQVKDGVREGKSLSQPLEQSGFFDPMVVQMVAIGEEIGELSNMFKRLNNFYLEYIDTFLARFTAMFEPMMILFLGFVIGAMVVGIFMPIFEIAKLGSAGGG